MNRIICIVALLLFSSGLQAQPAERTDPRVKNRRAGDRVEAIKVAYITDRLELSAGQATMFWPVYNEYEQELRSARKSFRQKYRDGASQENDADATRYIEDNLNFQEQAVDIRRKYKDALLKTISAKQLAALYEAERDFKKLLLQQLRERRGR